MNITYEQGPNPKQRAPGRKTKKTKQQARVVVTLNVTVGEFKPPYFDAIDVLRPMIEQWQRDGREEELIDYLESQGVLIDSAGYEVSK